MLPLDLLAQSSDDHGLVAFCVFAALVVFAILAKAVSTVSPDAIAKKLRELQQSQVARAGGVMRREPSTEMIDLSREAAFEKRPGWSTPVDAVPLAPLRKKKKGSKRSAPAVAAAPEAQAAMNLRQAVIYSEILAPPLALRRRTGGHSRSAPWLR